jgi:membrane protease YdiL (CAAX protease family)
MEAQAIAADQTSRMQVAGSRRLTIILVAWLTTLLVSRLPQIILQEGFGIDASWIPWLWVGAGLLFVALSFAWAPAAPLRDYFLIMLIVLLATSILDPLVRGTAIWTSWFGAGQSEMVILFAERVLIVLETLLVIAALLLMGLKRGDFFLVKGDLGAAAAGVRLPGMKSAVSWRVFGPLLAILLTIFFVAIASTFVTPTAEAFAKALPLMPLALLAAALNAFGEETLYRAAPLSRLWPVVGRGQALLITSVWFGLGHFYGGLPPGMVGLVFSGLLAMLFGKAMLDTRGIVWPWVLHFLADTVIYIFLAMAVVSA